MRGSASRSGKRLLGGTLAVIALFGLWAATAALLSRPFLPSPMVALTALAAMSSDGTLWPHAWASLGRVLAALALSFPPAAAMGLAAGRSRRVDAVVSPLLYVIHPLPKAAFLPILMLLLGLGEASKIALMALITFSQVAVAVRDAARRIPAQLLDSVRSLGAGRGALVRYALVPAILPDTLTALRVSLGTSVAVLFLAETFATETGLGFLIVDSWARIDYPDMYAAILALSALGLALFAAVDASERILCPWRPGED